MHLNFVHRKDISYSVRSCWVAVSGTRDLLTPNYRKCRVGISCQLSDVCTSAVKPKSCVYLKEFVWWRCVWDTLVLGLNHCLPCLSFTLTTCHLSRGLADARPESAAGRWAMHRATGFNRPLRMVKRRETLTRHMFNRCFKPAIEAFYLCWVTACGQQR